MTCNSRELTCYGIHWYDVQLRRVDLLWHTLVWRATPQSWLVTVYIGIPYCTIRITKAHVTNISVFSFSLLKYSSISHEWTYLWLPCLIRESFRFFCSLSNISTSFVCRLFPLFKEAFRKLILCLHLSILCYWLFCYLSLSLSLSLSVSLCLSLSLSFSLSLLLFLHALTRSPFLW